MTRASDKALLRRYHEEGDLAAREQLIEQYLSLVRSLARRYAYRGEQLDDLVQIGCIGLIKAIDRFDIDRGVELTTYATPNIIGEIKRHFRDKGWAVRVPRGLQELNVQLSKIVEDQTVQLGRSPTIPELAKAAGVEEELVLEALESGRAYTSLSLSASGSDEDGELDPLESLGTEEHQYSVSEDRAVLAPGFRALDERERRILHLRFFDGLTQSQIAQQVGISQMHVSRLIRRALEKIRDEIATRRAARGARTQARRRASTAPTLPACERLASSARASSPSSRRRATSGCRRGRSSLAPDDHSTLLTTAGMQPQMPFFLGLEDPPAPLTTVSQKCFRTQDIDEVGRDGHHLTFFEMLGNFSFGQYFKQGAVELATEFIQERLRLDWDRIWVTVHAGDPVFKLGPDEEAIKEWEAIGMPPERIVALPSSENFWSVGGPGPCGPDSEIYWDWGEQYGCGDPTCAPACPRCDRFLEFWNLVFMSFEQHQDGTLTPLPQQNIDTGMGLERLAAIIQDVRSVYETDGYQAIMAWVAQESGVAFGDSKAATKAHRVLADHGRGMTFLVGDGVTPSNEGRGYVLRRIIRRAVQQARTIGLDDLWRLSDVVVDQMGQWFPGAAGEPRAHPRRAPRRGGAVHRDARTRDEALRGGGRARSHLGERRVRAGHHVRLSVRTDHRARGRARPAGRRGRLPAADGRASRDLAWRRRAHNGRSRRTVDRLRRLRTDGGADGDRRLQRPRGRAVRGEARAFTLLSGRRRPGQ